MPSSSPALLSCSLPLMTTADDNNVNVRITEITEDERAVSPGHSSGVGSSISPGNCDAAQQFLSLGEAVIIRMRGLPYDCTAEKIIEFFKNGDNAILGDLSADKDILFVNKTDGKATGDAFVRFNHKGDDVRALARHKQIIGTRYIELFRSTTAEVQQVLNKTMEPPSKTVADIGAIPGVPAATNAAMAAAMAAAALPAAQCLMAANAAAAAAAAAANTVPGAIAATATAPLIVGGVRRDCVRLRGLPYEAQVQHVLDFLGEYARHVLLQGVHMVLNAQGHPSGEAFIQLDSEVAAASAAAERHNKYMQIGRKQRYIEVFQCSADDMNLVLTGPTALQTSLISAANALQARPIISSGASLIYPNAGATLTAANLLPTAQFVAAAQQPHAAALLQHLQLLNSTAAASTATLSTGAATLAQTAAFPGIINGATRLPLIQNFAAPVVPTTVSTPSGTLLYWPYPSPPVSPSSYYAAAIMASQSQQQPVMVLLRGLPFTATANDILNLFQGYPDLTADCIQIQRAANGQATGEALVTFPNRFEAERAILEKNRQLVDARPVELYIHGI